MRLAGAKDRSARSTVPDVVALGLVGRPLESLQEIDATGKASTLLERDHGVEMEFEMTMESKILRERS